MNADELKARTTSFAIRIIRLVSALPCNLIGEVLGRQLLKSGTSVGANYREATRGTSRADFLAKIKIVERELDETIYWLELLEAAGLMSSKQLAGLYKEAHELLAIFTSIAKTTRSRPMRTTSVNCKS